MYHDFLILGGAGLVGLQVCRHIIHQLDPRRIVVASLLEAEAQEAVQKLEAEFGRQVSFVAAWGNLFVPTDLANAPRRELMADPSTRARLLAALYEDFEAAFAENHLVRLISDHRPAVIVDCVNTATGLSYQNVFEGVALVRDHLSDKGIGAEGVADLETFLLSQSAPQIIRHVRFLHRATTECKTAVYIKVGTTGTGGMGLNIPYTHSEDKPSKVLLAKTEAAFGHTGLMFLMARTPDGPIVKEVKPAAMIGYRGVRVRDVTDKHGNRDLYAPRRMSLSEPRLELREDDKAYEKQGQMSVPVVDTGENGVFTRGEFAAITALGQMEFITPEEIARTVVQEIRGANTGGDCIAALDAAVLNPTYKAGLLRSTALADLAQVEEESGLPSVALGKLGPPELSKLLFEAQLLKLAFPQTQQLVDGSVGPRAMASACLAVLESSGVATFAPSIGIPIVLPDGETILRGPRINVPEVAGHHKRVDLGDPAKVDRWAAKGWVDLRASNMEKWQARFQRVLQSRVSLREQGSAASTISAFMGDSFEIGEIVAWIFNNEMGGYRIK